MEIQKIKTVRVSTTMSNQMINVETTATTWGELKKDIPDISLEGMRVVLLNMDTREKQTLDFDENKIPENAAICIMPAEKNKSGLDINTLTYNELRKLATSYKISSIGSSPTKLALIDAITYYLNSSSDSEKTKTIEKLNYDIEEIKKPFNLKDEVTKLRDVIFNQIEGLQKALIIIKNDEIKIITDIEYLSEKEFKTKTTTKTMTDKEVIESFGIMTDDEIMSTFNSIIRNNTDENND